MGVEGGGVTRLHGHRLGLQVAGRPGGARPGGQPVGGEGGQGAQAHQRAGRQRRQGERRQREGGEQTPDVLPLRLGPGAARLDGAEPLLEMHRWEGERSGETSRGPERQGRTGRGKEEEENINMNDGGGK